MPSATLGAFKFAPETFPSDVSLDTTALSRYGCSLWVKLPFGQGFLGFFGIDKTIIALESGTQNLQRLQHPLGVFIILVWPHSCKIGVLEMPIWHAGHVNHAKRVNRYRTRDHYLACGKLLVSTAVVATATTITCDEPSVSFKILQFSMLTPILLCTVTLHTVSYLHQVASSLKGRTTADLLSFV